jgi:hypothetical protein
VGEVVQPGLGGGAVRPAGMAGPGSSGCPGPVPGGWRGPDELPHVADGGPGTRGLAALPGGQGFDPGIPNVARIYDALLGGKDNYAADREAARRLVAAVPGAAHAARENRAFLARAVSFLAGEAGMRQFIDIGTGLPAGGHVHEIAQAADPGARVAYADNDPVVVAHANALLAGAPTVAVVHADVRYPRHLMTLPALRAFIDFDQPVAVLLVAVLHFVADSEDPWAIARCITGYLAAGSYLVVSHVTGDEITADAARQARAIYDGASAPGVTRSKDDIGRFFDGLEMVPPGVVDVAAWRSGPRHGGTPGAVLFYAGIGRKASGVPGGGNDTRTG